MVGVAVRSECESRLRGLDDEVMEYVVEMVGGDEDSPSVASALSLFILSCGLASLEDEAARMIDDLFNAIGRKGEGGEEGVEGSPPPKLRILDQKTSIADSDAHLFRDKTADEL
ncbi:MAG: hypothetical protein SGPRY_009027, partial [Prymnesium sp.]